MVYFDIELLLKKDIRKAVKIMRSNVSCVDGRLLALLVRRLVDLEVRPGGPYYTNNKIIDIDFNSDVAHLLHYFDIHLENLEQYVYQHTAGLKSINSPNKSDTFSKQNNIYSAPALAVKEQLKDVLSLYISPQILEQLWDGVAKADRYHEISCLVEYYASSLFSRQHSTKEMLAYGMANFYTWMAYSVYDDIVDSNDLQNIHLLPVANILQRQALMLYVGLCQKSNIQDFFHTTDQGIWEELTFCRLNVSRHAIIVRDIDYYKNTMIVVRKSTAHIGGVYLYALKRGLSNKQLANLKNGLNHYLVARQLNDDLYDWVEDVRAGHVSYVVDFLLKKAAINPGEYRVNDLIVTLKKALWDGALVELCAIILDHVDNAYKHYSVDNMLHENTLFCEKTLAPIERATWQSVIKHSRQKEFLRYYGLQRV